MSSPFIPESALGGKVALVLGRVLVSALVGCAWIQADVGLVRAQQTSLQDLYTSGTTFETFLDEAERRRDRWVDNYGSSRVDADLLQRTGDSLDQPIHLLAVAVDGCSDSVNTIPHLARLAEAVEGLDLRIIDPSAGRLLMEANRTPDDRAATPTVLVLDASFNVIDVFIERPRLLQDWALSPEGKRLDSDSFLAAKFAWYDADAGRSTMEEVVTVIEFSRVSNLFGGNFSDDYDIQYAISARTWIQDPSSIYHVVEWNEQEQFLVARNDVRNGYAPGAWTRIDWLELENMPPFEWAFCLTAFEAASLEEARQSALAVRGTPLTGCGGHPFSRMRRLD